MATSNEILGDGPLGPGAGDAHDGDAELGGVPDSAPARASEARASDDECEACERPHSAPWTFLTNHSHVLLCLAHEPDQTLRKVATCVGITERAVQRIVADLESADIITRHREGRCNRYSVNYDAPLRHDLEAHKTIGDLMAMVWGERASAD